MVVYFMPGTTFLTPTKSASGLLRDVEGTQQTTSTPRGIPHRVQHTTELSETKEHKHHTVRTHRRLREDEHGWASGVLAFFSVVSGILGIAYMELATGWGLATYVYQQESPATRMGYMETMIGAWVFCALFAIGAYFASGREPYYGGSGGFSSDSSYEAPISLGRGFDSTTARREQDELNYGSNATLNRAQGRAPWDDGRGER